MNEPLSIFELITGASIAVLLVMLLLVLASVASWIMIFNRWRVLRVAIHELDTFEDYFASSVVRKKMGLDKMHPLIARIRNFLARLNGFLCRNVKFFEKLFSRDEYVLNSLVNSNKEFQKEIAKVTKLYYMYPVK